MLCVSGSAGGWMSSGTACVSNLCRFLSSMLLQWTVKRFLTENVKLFIFLLISPKTVKTGPISRPWSWSLTDQRMLFRKQTWAPGLSCSRWRLVNKNSAAGATWSCSNCCARGTSSHNARSFGWHLAIQLLCPSRKKHAGIPLLSLPLPPVCSPLYCSTLQSFVIDEVTQGGVAGEAPIRRPLWRPSAAVCRQMPGRLIGPD